MIFFCIQLKMSMTLIDNSIMWKIALISKSLSLKLIFWTTEHETIPIETKSKHDGSHSSSKLELFYY